MYYLIATFAMSIYGQPYGQPITAMPYTPYNAQACIAYATDYNQKHSPNLQTCAVVMVTKDGQGNTHWQTVQ